MKTIFIIAFSLLMNSPSFCQELPTLVQSFVLRSKISSSVTATMLIKKYSNNSVTVTRGTEPFLEGDKQTIYFYDNSYYSETNRSIIMPNNGKKYRVIYFDPSQNPPFETIASGGTVVVACLCLSDCDKADCQDIVVNGTIACGGVEACTNLSEDGLDSEPCGEGCQLPVAIVILEAEALTLDGVTHIDEDNR